MTAKPNFAGELVAVCSSIIGGIPKYPQAVSVRLREHGLDGDFHCRPERWSFRRQIMVPNVDRHLSIVAQEVIDDLNQQLGISLAPGSLGENLTVRGLGDLSQIRDGTTIQIGDGILLEVVEQIEPCKNLYSLHRLLVKKIFGRRGIYCRVTAGVGSMIRPGMPVHPYTTTADMA